MDTSALLVFSLFLVVEGYVLKDDNTRFESQQWNGRSRSANGHQGVFSGAAVAAESGIQVKGGVLSVASAVGKDCSEENEDTTDRKTKRLQSYNQNLQTNQRNNDEQQKSNGFTTFKNGNADIDDRNLQFNNQNEEQRYTEFGSEFSNNNHGNSKYGESQNLQGNQNIDDQQKLQGLNSLTNSNRKLDGKYIEDLSSNQEYRNARQQKEFNDSGSKIENKYNTNYQNSGFTNQNNGYHHGHEQNNSHSFNYPENHQLEEYNSQTKRHKDQNVESNEGRTSQQLQNLDAQYQNYNANHRFGSNSAQGYSRGDFGFNSKERQYGKYTSPQSNQQFNSQNYFRDQNNDGQGQQKKSNSLLAQKEEESTNSQDVQSTVGDALKLASEGLKTSEKASCSTCEKSTFAFSNAKSNSGSAVAISIGG